MMRIRALTGIASVGILRRVANFIVRIAARFRMQVNSP